MDFNGYMMKGVDGEFLFVVRSYNYEDIIKILEEMTDMNSHGHRQLAKQLLKEFYARED